MIARLDSARIWFSRFFVVLVIVAAVAKDHVFEAAGLRASALSPPTVHSSPNGVQSAAPEASTAINMTDILYVVALIFLYALLEVGADASIARFKWVRKLIMGNINIEGEWLDLVFKSDVLFGGAYIHIYYEDGEYKIDGRNFGGENIWLGWFGTEMSRYAGTRLAYKYRGMRLVDLQDVTGHGEYNFSADSEMKLTNFAGFFYEDKAQERYYTYGERLASYLPNPEQRRDRTKPEKLPALVLQFIADRKGVLPVPSNLKGLRN
jgi:hypothetical protein